MQDERREPLTPREVMLLSIQEFFDQNLYGTRRQPFRLLGLAENDHVKQVRPESNAWICCLQGVEDEDLIGEPDWEWLKKLSELGKRFEAELSLDPACFEK